MLLLIITVAFEYSFYYTQAYIKQFHYASWSYQQLSGYFSQCLLVFRIVMFACRRFFFELFNSARSEYEQSFRSAQGYEREDHAL